MVMYAGARCLCDRVDELFRFVFSPLLKDYQYIVRRNRSERTTYLPVYVGRFVVPLHSLLLGCPTRQCWSVHFAPAARWCSSLQVVHSQSLLARSLAAVPLVRVKAIRFGSIRFIRGTPSHRAEVGSVARDPK